MKPNPLTEDQHQALLSLALEDLSDARDRLSLKAGGFIPGIRPLGTKVAPIVANVMTVELVPDGYPPTSRSHLGAGAIDAANPGQLIVVDHKGRTDCAGWGGLLSRGAAIKGLAGTVVYGAVRDVDEAQELNFPVFGLAITAVSARGRVVERSFGQPIQCGGITVELGDVAIVGAAGAFIVPSASVGVLVETAKEIQGKQDEMARRLREGAAVADVMGEAYEQMLHRP